jgi:hypothetical protein
MNKVALDFILNGVAQGSVASRLMAANGDVGIFRPYWDSKGRTCVTLNKYNPRTGKIEPQKMVINAAATMRYDEWRQLDTAVLKAARGRLRFVADLRAGGLQFTIPNGLAKTVLSSEKSTDPGSASVSMDGLRKGQNDRQEYAMENLPLPLIHSDFSFSARQIMVSRESATPLDTAAAEAAARRVAEVAEQMCLGNWAGGDFAFGGGTIYGATTFPQRITKLLTLPTLSAWVPKTTLNEVLAMKQASISQLHFGPWILYAATNWDQYLDNDYILTGGNVATQTLRERLKAIDGIQDVRALDFLTGYQMLLVQQSSDVIREIVGLDFTTVQWPEEGGLKMNYKVMAILVPQLRADINGNTGIVHGSPVAQDLLNT